MLSLALKCNKDVYKLLLYTFIITLAYTLKVYKRLFFLFFKKPLTLSRFL